MNIIVFSPHPDDAEVLMGGTIAQHTRSGHVVKIVLVTIPSQKEQYSWIRQCIYRFICRLFKFRFK